MTRINQDVNTPKMDSHKVQSHKDAHKFKKIYKETKERKNEQRKYEEKEAIPLHLLFSSQDPSKKEELPINLPEVQQCSVNMTKAPEHVVSTVPLDPQILDVFEKMVNEMTVMTSRDIIETTITLNAPDYSSSPFYGAQIIISEYSTAPRAFNIQFRAAPEAVALFQCHVKDLMAAFEGSGYNFKVNRLETDYLDDQPDSFKRKERVSLDEKENDL